MNGNSRILTPSEVEATAQILADGGNVSKVAKALNIQPTQTAQLKGIVHDPGIQKRAVELVKTKFKEIGRAHV